MCEQTETTPFLILFFPDKLWPFLYFFGSFYRSYPPNKLKKGKFPFVGRCMINTVSNNHVPYAVLIGATPIKQKISTLVGPAGM